MKKRVIALFVLLSLSLSAAAAGLPTGWYSLRGDGVELSPFFLPEGSSVSVPDSMGLSPLDESVSFTAAPGEYVVGVDFPAGVYSVRCADGQSLINIKIRDESGKTLFSDGFWANEGTYLGKYEFLDGYSVSLDQGLAYFSAPSGIVFDSPSVSASAEQPSDRLYIDKPKSSLVDVAESALENIGSDGE